METTGTVLQVSRRFYVRHSYSVSATFALRLIRPEIALRADVTVGDKLSLDAVAYDCGAPGLAGA